MKDMMEKQQKPGSLTEAESMLTEHLQRKTERDSRDASFSATINAGEKLLAEGISWAFSEQIKQGLDSLRKASALFQLHTYLFSVQKFVFTKIFAHYLAILQIYICICYILTP